MSSISLKHLREENWEQRCGEIYMTTGRNMVFHCSLCANKYMGFGEYVTHLDEHFPALDVFNIEEVQMKHEDPYEALNSLNANLFEETAIYLTEIENDSIENNKKNEGEVSDDKDYECNSEENQQSDSKDEPSCRPVRLRTMYFQKPGEIRKFKCTLCSAKFKDTRGLNKHKQRHKMQKSHQCPQCPKKFYAPIDVKIHLRSHSGERPFLCTICGKTCLSNVQLKDHMRRHTNQRDYKCLHCEKSFYNSNLLMGHMPVHTKERRHKCDVCDSNFTYRKGLRNHMKIHENKRAYKCDLCGATFNQQAGLFCHIKNKHKKRKF